MATSPPKLTSTQKLTIHGFGASSPGYWGKVVELQIARIRGHQHDFYEWAAAARRGEAVAERLDETWTQLAYPWRIGLDANYLLYGARNVLRYADHYEENLSSPGYKQQVQAARAWFDAAEPHAKRMRDVIEHIDEYAIGAGRHELPNPGNWGVVAFVDDETPEGLLGEVTYDFGGLVIPLHRLAENAIFLAKVLHGLWEAEVLRTP
jgi:hypothetical protein